MTPAFSSAGSPVLCRWSVPGLSEAEEFEIVAREGEVTTIVGANGAGKSALAIHLHTHSANSSRLLIAHRRLWFQSAGPNITPSQRLQTGKHMETWSRQTTTRYVDHADGQRADIVLFDVLARLNSQNAKAVALFNSGASPEEVAKEVGLPLLDRLNAILADAGLKIQLVVTDDQEFHALNSQRGAEYPIFQMSDGEKSAVLLASEVLVAPAQTVLVIDEPERHLHRSISAALVAAVVASRPDCHFVVLTHDLELANWLSMRAGRTYSVMDCRWEGESAVGWQIHELEAAVDMPEDARRAILGGRERLLFIEGQNTSVDLRLYGILFPNWTLSPSGGADQVIRAVTGLRESARHHWVRAFGLVDGDGRTDSERASLEQRGIIVLPVSEVENLYYLELIIDAVMRNQAHALDRPELEMRKIVRERALAALAGGDGLERLSSQLALARIRRKVADSLPTVASAEAVNISFESPYSSILREVEAIHSKGDLDALVRLLPIRDTPMRHQVATSLGFRSADDFESAARVCLRSDDALRSEVQALIGLSVEAA